MIPQRVTIRPGWLFRRWKDAAGPVFRQHIPAAPFSALANFGPPPIQPLLYDEASQELATGLAPTLEAQAVQAGEAAFVVDLPGPVSVGLGYYLRQFGISPVLLFGGVWRPGALLDRGESATALIQYGSKLNQAQTGSGYAFLLERERLQEVAPLKLIDAFDNRYRAFGLFPPVAQLPFAAIIDLRLAGDALPDDLAAFYEKAAQAGLDIFQAAINM